LSGGGDIFPSRGKWPTVARGVESKLRSKQRKWYSKVIYRCRYLSRNEA